MRHAKSAWDTGEPDFQRPLAPRGERNRATMARWLLDQHLAPDRVLSSSAVRARSTAQHVADTFGLAPDRVEFDDDLYHAGFRLWLGRLRDEPDSTKRLLICGHNPSLDLLVEMLASTEPPRSASDKLMTTAAIAHLRLGSPWCEVSPGCAALVTIARPREL
ncbi:MAG: histidine phosphatase family protein [Actinomycetota bacterium]